MDSFPHLTFNCSFHATKNVQTFLHPSSGPISSLIIYYAFIYTQAKLYPLTILRISPVFLDHVPLFLLYLLPKPVFFPPVPLFTSIHVQDRKVYVLNIILQTSEKLIQTF